MLTDEEYPELLEDIRTECEQSGKVTTVKIPRAGEPGAGLVYVEYEAVASAAKAKESLHKRLFDGNVVSAIFVPPGSF